MLSDSTIATIVTGSVTITTVVVTFLTLWVKLKYGVESKIDNNTEVTKAGARVASDNAKVAASAASIAAQKAVATEDKIMDMLNGHLESRIRNIVRECFDPLNDTIRSHVEQDDRNMVEIRTALDELRNLDK